MNLRILNLLAVAVLFTATVFTQSTSLKFEITEAKGVAAEPQNGRLFIFINKKNDREPRLVDGEVSYDAPPMLARDVKKFGSGSTAVIDNSSISVR